MTTETAKTPQSSFLADMMQAAKRTPGNILGGPVDIANLALGLVSGKGLQGLSAKPVGGSESINNLFGLGSVNNSMSGTQAATEGVLSMFSPSGATTSLLKGGAAASGVLGTYLAMGAKNAKTAKELGSKLSKERGIIVPLTEMPDSTVASRSKLTRLAETHPESAFGQYGIYLDPLTGRALLATDDSLKMITQSMTKKTPLPNGKFATELSEDGMLTDFISLNGFPPALQDYLRAVKVARQPNVGASYSAADDLIRIGPANNVMDLTRNMLHEIQHGSQFFYDMPRGGNPASFYEDYAGTTNAREIVDEMLRQKGTTAKDYSLPRMAQGTVEKALSVNARTPLLGNEQALRSLSDMLTQSKHAAYRHYLNIPGEAEARLVENLYMSPFNGSSRLPLDRMLDNPQVSVPRLKQDAATIPKVDSDPVTRAIRSMILGQP